MRTDYTVSGMTCEHCVASVTEELAELADVQRVEVALDVATSTGAVTVTSAAPLDRAAVAAAVALAGYELR